MGEHVIKINIRVRLHGVHDVNCSRAAHLDVDGKVDSSDRERKHASVTVKAHLMNKGSKL